MIRKGIGVGLFLWMALSVASWTAATTYSEEAVKAAFLYRFGSYVQWPSLGPDDAPFVIGVMGADGVAAELQRLLPSVTIQNRPAEVRKVEHLSQLEDVRILYIGPGHLRAARRALAAVAHRPVLVVTDDDDGLAKGGVINFVRIQHSVRFEVSLTAAERTSLRIKSGLLSVAARVEGAPRANVHCSRSRIANPDGTECPRLAHRSLRASNAPASDAGRRTHMWSW